MASSDFCAIRISHCFSSSWAADFFIQRVGRENIVSMGKKTPHMHLIFVPMTKDSRLCAKGIVGNRASLSRLQDDFHVYMVKAFPDLKRRESGKSQPEADRPASGIGGGGHQPGTGQGDFWLSGNMGQRIF